MTTIELFFLFAPVIIWAVVGMVIVNKTVNRAATEMKKRIGIRGDQ